MQVHRSYTWLVANIINTRHMLISAARNGAYDDEQRYLVTLLHFYRWLTDAVIERELTIKQGGKAMKAKLEDQNDLVMVHCEDYQDGVIMTRAEYWEYSASMTAQDFACHVTTDVDPEIAAILGVPMTVAAVAHAKQAG